MEIHGDTVSILFPVRYLFHIMFLSSILRLATTLYIYILIDQIAFCYFLLYYTVTLLPSHNN